MQLRYLIAIVDAGLSITQAAERVFATQPGISKQLRQLESELGFQIFSRRGKSLEAVTSAGALVIERARTIVTEASNIRVLAAHLRNAASDKLRIATTHTQAKYVLPASVAAMAGAFPEVAVSLLPASETETLALLETGEVDIAIVSTASGPPRAGCAIPLYRWKRHVIVPRDHPLARLETGLTIERLGEHQLVSYDSARRSDSSVRTRFNNAGMDPRITCTARDAELIKTYVRAGLGVGILAEMAWLPEDGTDLSRVITGALFPECTTWLLLPRDTLLRGHVLRFIHGLAPWLDSRDVQRAVESGEPIAWPKPPEWPRFASTRVSMPVRLDG